MSFPMRAAILLNLALLAGATATAAQDMRIASLGTGTIAGNYFAMGRALCAAVNDLGPTDLRCSPEPTPGSHYNLIELAEGGMEFAIVQSDWQRAAVEGTGRFAQTGPDAGLRSVASLYPEAVTIIVPADSDIESLDDLRGRRIDIGDASTPRRATNLAFLSALSFDVADISRMPGFSGAAVAAEICARRIDATIIVIGHPSSGIAGILGGCDLRLVAMDQAQIPAILEANAEFSAYTLPAGTYNAVTEDIPMLAVMATLVVRDGVDDGVVTQFARALTENAALVSRRAPVFQPVARETMAQEGLTAPLHPSAGAVLGVSD